MAKVLTPKFTIQDYASFMGRLGGKVKSARKAKSSAENGKLGGRPRKIAVEIASGLNTQKSGRKRKAAR